MSQTWIMIPARGGSRGVPRKNVRLLGGVPLIVHSIRAAVLAVPASHVFVMTDDDEIAAVARSEGVGVLREERTTGLATLDDVARKVLAELVQFGAAPEDAFLTVQPTCPFIRPERITEASNMLAKGAGSVITVVDDRHLGWRIGSDGMPEPDYAARVNRQFLPPQFRESGAVIGCRIETLMATGTRINQPVRLVEVTKAEALDIDDFSDWAVAEHMVSRRRIVIRVDGGPTLGLGHIYRALALAQELARHDVLLVTDASQQLGGRILSDYPFPHQPVDGEAGFLALLAERPADLVILDQLDTETGYVRAVRAHAGRIVTFEDLGPGAAECDLLVSDLYENINVPPERQLQGLANSVLAPHFETLGGPRLFQEKVGRILVVFGGTDPSRLTEKALSALSLAKFDGHVDLILGPGLGRSVSLDDYSLNGEVLRNVRYMPEVMHRADLALSSAGRTVTELLTCGVPVLCMCQNDKELTHTHAAARYGVVNLGLGELIDPVTIAAHVRRLVESSDLRRVLHARAKHELSGRSNAAIIRRMMRHVGLDGSGRVD